MSSKEASKINWHEIRQQYLAEHEKNGITAVDFFKKNGLNPNSGRRNFSALAKKEQAGIVVPEKEQEPKTTTKKNSANKKDDRQEKRSSKVKSDHLTRSSSKRSSKSDHQKNEKTTSNKTSKGGEPQPKVEQAEINHKKEMRLTYLQPERFRDISSDQQSLNGGRFSQGNAAGTKHGGYLSITSIDEDIVDLVTQNSPLDIHGVNQLAEARFLMMNRLLDERVMKLKTDHENGVKWFNDDNTELTLSDMLRQAYWGSIPCLTNLYSSVAIAKVQAAKAQVDMDVKTYKLLREQSDHKVFISLLNKAQENADMSAMELVTMIENQGLKAPQFLLAQAVKELEQIKPAIEENSITDADIEAMLLEQQSKLSGQVFDMTARNKELAAMMAESKAELELGALSESDFNPSDLDDDYDDELDDEEFEEIAQDEWD